MTTLTIPTSQRTEFVEITTKVQKAVTQAGIKQGVCYLFVPHTTAGVMINENADADVARDIRVDLDRLVPHDGDYRHSEGNSDSHIKAALVGASLSVFVENGKLALGRWQGIFFCEFDGPRERQLQLKILREA
ncbi:MAG TPA: secondary thiamine-phosphate synthase enzyme YjbQ [Candidatus Dormibacteraeota bacterium]|nr:secondary thiamine-phosphate synthase enzyme YjbQ [Candidatus Dormibacteraeota bacterium]